MLSDEQILQVLDHEIDLAKEFTFSQIAKERAYAYDLYYRKPMGNEVEGRSQVVSSEVSNAIDSTLPILMEMFIASDKAVEFAPRKAEDVLSAEQATDVGNYVFYSQNRGYSLIHDGLKDGLLQKTGAFKWRWEKNQSVVEETYYALNDQQFAMLQSDPEVEIVAYSSQPIAMSPDGQPLAAHSVTVKKKKESGQVKIIVIPPEELLLSPRAKGQEVSEHPFIGHAPLLTRSELIELGVDASILDELDSGDDDLSLSEERISRNERTELTDWHSEASGDTSQTRYRYYECYLNIDVDEDGIAERRRICKVGGKLVHDDIVDHVPMSYWTPKGMPHEPIGMSMADDVADLQELGTALTRGALDSIYLSLAPRIQFDPDMNSGLPTLDDILTVRAGGVIRARTGSINPIVQPYVGRDAFDMLEYVQQQSEQRTGAFRFGQGLDPNALNKTATVAALQNSSMQGRLKIYARNFAEQALIPLFRGIMYLLSKNQTEALTIRLRNTFAAIDPRVWTTEYDMTVNTGLGSGTKEQQTMALDQLAQAQAMIAQSPYAQKLLTPKNIFNLQSKKCELWGYKDPERYFSDPDKVPDPPPPGPPPEVQLQQMKGEQAMQLEQAKGAIEQSGKQADLSIEQMKLQMEYAFKEKEAAMKLDFEYRKAQLDADVKLQIGAMQAQAAAQRPAFPQ